MKKIHFVLGLFAAASLAGVGCAAPDASDAPEGSVDGISDSASVTINGNTITAITPTNDGISVWGSASFTASGRQGVCLLEVTSTVCQLGGPKDASGQPVDCPHPWAAYGGFTYCQQVNATGSAYCMNRRGTQAQYCGGSPALPRNADGTPQTIGAGTYDTGAYNYSRDPSTHKWVSYACLNGCSGSDPSVSSAGFTTKGCASGSVNMC